MFDHVTLRVADLAESLRFYETVLGELGIRGQRFGDWAEWEDFSIVGADPDHPPATRLHVGFVASSPALVDAFWQAGVAAGFASDGEPGPRPQYGSTYYGGFLRDPDGNSAEAVHHESLRRGGRIDHLWLRVADLEAATRFYVQAGELAGFTLRRERDDPPRAQFTGGSGSFSVVHDGEPARNVHLAFGADNDAAVDRFHETLVAAGYRDNGPPGERPMYHRGYYGAYVLDPDGNNVELVHHARAVA